MKITAHSLVKNEERFIWFSVMSVIRYVDKIFLWDTGSTDNTVKIIKEILKVEKVKDRVEFKEVGEVDVNKFTDVRQKMLEETDSDWFMIVDGDEVWWEDSIKQIVSTIRTEGEKLDFIVSPYYNIVGDIYHYQDAAAGLYKVGDHSGHINIRAVNKHIEGLHFNKPHGQQGLYDDAEILIQNRNPLRYKFLNEPYMHFTNVVRSGSRKDDLKVPKRNLKLKYDLGIPFPKTFKYPEIFYLKRPSIVSDPWVKRSKVFTIRAIIETPFRRMKRRVFKSKVGY